MLRCWASLPKCSGKEEQVGRESCWANLRWHTLSLAKPGKMEGIFVGKGQGKDSVADGRVAYSMVPKDPPETEPQSLLR